MSRDERHPIIRFFAWVEAKCPWAHLIVFGLLTAAAVMIGPQRLRGCEWLITVTVFAYLLYLIRLVPLIINFFARVQTMEARIVAVRCETVMEELFRDMDIECYYCAFKPLNGGPYMELRVRSKMDYVQLSNGDTGTVRFRRREFLSFEKHAARAEEPQEASLPVSTGKADVLTHELDE